VSFDFQKNPRGSHLQFGSFILWSWMVYIGANHAPWQHGTLGFESVSTISFSGLAVIWNFKSLRKNFPEDTLPSTALQLAMTALGCTGTLS